MGLTISYKEGKDIIEKCGLGYKMLTGSIAFTGTYTSNGETMDLRKAFPRDLHMVQFENKAGYMFEYMYSTRKVKVFYPTKTQAVAASAGNQPTVGTAATVSGAPAIGTLAVAGGSATASAVDATTPSLTGAPAIGSLDAVLDSGAVTIPSGFRSAVNPGVAEEVGSGASLTALTDVRFFAIGK